MFNIPSTVSDILAISFDNLGSPSISIDLSKKNLSTSSKGWGFGWYPNDQQSTMVIKEPLSSDSKVFLEALTDWSNFRSTVFFCKSGGSSNGYSQKEAQPFSRSFAGKDWLFMHNGDLDKVELEKLNSKKSRLLEPLGNTDSEIAFCNILSLIEEGFARNISELDPQILLSRFQIFDTLGSSNMTISDGESIVAFQGSNLSKQLYYSRIQPPNNQETYQSETIQFSFSDPRDNYRTTFIVSSEALSGCNWKKMTPGQMIIIKRGSLVWNNNFEQDNNSPKIFINSFTQQDNPKLLQNIPRERILNTKAISLTEDGLSLGYRLFDVTHTTHYEYANSVEHSTHNFRLQPIEDLIQEVIYSKFFISSLSEQIQYEDVFGNQAIHCVIGNPYKQLTVESTSRVKIFATPPDDHGLSRRNTSIPLAWMPWQRQMMMPYLLSEELPESQLTELTEYAMSFVKRNNYNLLNTLKDINLSIYQDYKYKPKSTSLDTTPFEVYISRQGVCQDFANLFICLARLLSIPARYRMGYIYTGINYANKIQSDESHAWLEVYMPYVGWRGFDPTNGCSALQDHVRVACGRNYRDATPSSGTIYKGGGKEILSTGVKMIEITKPM